MEAKQWAVQIHITEEGDETFARAVLSTGAATHLAGVGRARRNPIDEPVTEIGDELAAARALADLAGRLLNVASADISQLTGPTSW
ncbi:dsRBD fold-containing protein [Streptosporangium sp. NPDC051023]|uniref:dsRBD fold-containing protein n=1 Tax=Streptosporangium sp. NPDC051023 TaxID=3155410 RepID=UPI00344B2625